MSDLTQRLTGITDAGLLEYDFPRVHSRSQVNFNGPIPRDVRMAAGLIVFSDEIDKTRKALRKDPKGFLRRRRKEAQNRLKKRGLLP